MNARTNEPGRLALTPSVVDVILDTHDIFECIAARCTPDQARAALAFWESGAEQLAAVAPDHDVIRRVVSRAFERRAAMAA